MNTCFKVLFASYNILQYLCNFIHVFIFVIVSKYRNNLKLTNIDSIEYTSNEQSKTNRKMSTCNQLDLESRGSCPKTSRALFCKLISKNTFESQYDGLGRIILRFESFEPRHTSDSKQMEYIG